MRNKTLLSSLILGLLILVIGITACGRTSVPGDRVKTIPHDVDWGFTNCLVCHTGGDIALPAIFHPTNPTNEECLNPGCHWVEGSIPTTTPPVTTTTTPPVTDTTTPPVTDTTTPPVTTTTTTEPPVTTTTGPPPIISIEFHPGVKDASICFICHAGPEGQVVDPYPEDHAADGRANDSCLDDGCHEFEQQ